MITTLRPLTLRKLLTGLVVLAAALVFTNMHAPKVMAYDGNYCGVHTGSHADYEGLVATVLVQQPDGTQIPAGGTGDYVNVQSTTSNGTPRAAILYLSSGLGIISGPYQNVSFSLYGGGSACYGDGVLGYGGTSVSTINGNAGGGPGGGWWVIDCDTSTGTQSYFTVTGQGVPANAVAGGSWGAGTEVGPQNGSTGYATLVYYDPQPVSTGTTRGSVDVANCSLIGGWAESDPNPSNFTDPYPSTYVDIYVNGPAGSGAPGIRYNASDYRFDVGYHSFNITPASDPFMSTFYNSGSAFTIYVYAIGLNGAPNVYVGAWGIGPCVSPPAPPNISIQPSCSAQNVTINASDSTPGASLSVNYSSNNGGPSGSGSGNPFSRTISMSGLDSTKAYTFSATAMASNGAGSASASSTGTYGPCDKSPPTIKITPSCSGTSASFTVSDPDNSSANSTIHYSIDNASYSSSTTVRSDGSSKASISLAGYDQLLSHSIYAYTLGVQQSGATGNRQVFISPNPTTYPPCYMPTCGTSTVTPSVIEPNQSYTYKVTLGFTALNSAPAISSSTEIGGTLTVSLNGSTIGQFTPSTTPPLSTGSNSGTAIAPSIPSDTVYTLSWTFSDSSVTTSPSPCGGGPAQKVIVAYKPNIQVLGGDTSVGGGFAPNCTPAAKPAGAIAWNQDNPPTYTGAGDQFAVYALGPIDGFATAQNSASAGGTAKGLAFANDGGTYPITSDEFGGGLTKTPCSTDYYSSAPTPTGAVGSLPPLPTSTTTPAWSYTGNQTITGGNIPNGQHVTIYVTGGDVTITGNITLNNAPYTPYTSISDIPSFRLVVESGNIIIRSSVTQLDGVYIAQPDSVGTGGVITTCEDGPTVVFHPAAGNPNCFNNPLTVNGSFVAQSVLLARSNDDSTGPAEKFVYSPANWLASPGSKTPSKYDSITSLPPVL